MSGGCYFVEFERDADGHKVFDPVSGYQLTQRSQEARREYRSKLLKGREPRRDLPDYLRADPRFPYQKPPRLHYGLAFNNKQLMDCVARFDIPLMDAPPDENDTRIAQAMLRVTRALSIACEMELYVTVPIDEENTWIISLYDNYNWWSERLVEEEEEEVVDIIRQALDIDLPLMWYYDAMQ